MTTDQAIEQAKTILNNSIKERNDIVDKIVNTIQEFRITDEQKETMLNEIVNKINDRN